MHFAHQYKEKRRKVHVSRLCARVQFNTQKSVYVLYQNKVEIIYFVSKRL